MVGRVALAARGHFGLTDAQEWGLGVKWGGVEVGGGGG